MYRLVVTLVSLALIVIVTACIYLATLPQEESVSSSGSSSFGESQVVKQENTKSVNDEVPSNLEVELARARGYLSEGSLVTDATLIKSRSEDVESMFAKFRKNESDSRLKEDSSGISLRYAIGNQGYKIKDNSFEVWTTKASDIENILLVLTGGSHEDIYVVLAHNKTSDQYHIIYFRGGRPDTFG